MAKTGRYRRGRPWAPFLCLLAAPALADMAPPPPLLQPVDCTGTVCRVIRYVDRDVTSGALDHRCGELTSDGHNGTDIGVPPVDAFGEGVIVRAAVSGRVQGVRDGMPDIEIENPNAPDVSGRECGNGLVIAHKGGWESQYCHLREGSILPRKGELVEAGDPIGLVGMSGKASAPHLHFALRYKHEVLDPFRTDASTHCNSEWDGFWVDGHEPAYTAGGLLQIGVLNRVPEYSEILTGLPRAAVSNASTEAIVLWGLFFGGQQSDRLVLTLRGPAQTVQERSFELAEDAPLFFRAHGLKRPESGFETGSYHGHVAHWRGKQVLEERKIQFELR